MQPRIMQSGTVQSGIVQSSRMQPGTMQFNAIQAYAIQPSTVLDGAVFISGGAPSGLIWRDAPFFCKRYSVNSEVLVVVAVPAVSFVAFKGSGTW